MGEVDQPEERQHRLDAWAPFLEGTADRPPLRFFDRAMEFVGGNDGRGRLAIDLGCGGGAETRALLDRGWSVFATDRSPTAERLLLDRVPPNARHRLTIAIGRFETVALPDADLVYAQMSLPFAGDGFAEATDAAIAAVRPGGAFVGHFFGMDDDWIANDDVTGVTRQWVEERFAAFDSVQIDEINEDGPFGLDSNTKHWHYYFVLAHR